MCRQTPICHREERFDVAIRSLVSLVMLKVYGRELRIATTGDIGHRFRNDRLR